MAEQGLEYVYYQTNQYHKALSLSGKYPSDVGDMMRAFGDRTPYQVSWSVGQETSIPFLVTEPLPVAQVEVNGELKNFIIDTGASKTYLNESLATALGIAPIASVTGAYAGGIEVKTDYGILNSLQMNGVKLESVPVIIADVSPFSLFMTLR